MFTPAVAFAQKVSSAWAIDTRYHDEGGQWCARAGAEVCFPKLHDPCTVPINFRRQCIRSGLSVSLRIACGLLRCVLRVSNLKYASTSSDWRGCPQSDPQSHKERQLYCGAFCACVAESAALWVSSRALSGLPPYASVSDVSASSKFLPVCPQTTLLFRHRFAVGAEKGKSVERIAGR